MGKRPLVRRRGRGGKQFRAAITGKIAAAKYPNFQLAENHTGIAIGDAISVKKIKAVQAEKIVVAPLEAIPPIDERYLADALESVPLIKGDNVMVPYFGGRLTFQIIGVTPATDAVLVTQKTVFHIAEKGETLRGVPQVTYEDIGGLTDEIKKVREMIELPLRHPEIFEKLGIEAPKGILLYGPPGTGKTMLAKAVANESNAHFISISGPEIMSKFYGESEARLREIFKEAREKSPSIIFIDEIDSIAPKREEVSGEVERRVVSQMLSLMDGLEARGKVIVISATNRPNAIDPALRRPGRFDREIEIKVPDKKGRMDILAIHTRNMPLSDDVDRTKVAAVTHGYVGADLEYLCKEAAMKCLRRLLPELNLEDEKVPPETLDKLIVIGNDFQKALKEVTPSGMREVFIENPDVQWDEVGGLDDVKRELQEAVEWPMKYPVCLSLTLRPILRAVQVHALRQSLPRSLWQLLLQAESCQFRLHHAIVFHEACGDLAFHTIQDISWAILLPLGVLFLHHLDLRPRPIGRLGFR